MYNNMNSPKDIAKKVLADILSSPQYGFQKFSKSNTPDIQNPGLNSSRYMSMLAELKERRMNMAAEAKKLQDENRKQSLDLMNTKLNELMLGKVDKMKNELEKIKKSYVLTNPKLLYKDNVVCLKNIIDKLELLNPLNILSRGYSITYMNDKALKSVKEVKKDYILKVKLYDGMLEAKVSKIEEDK